MAARAPVLEVHVIGLAFRALGGATWTATLLLALTAGLGASGCAVVKPWERAALAREDMAWDPDPLETARRGHVYFSREAAMDGGGAGGGGCGCN